MVQAVSSPTDLLIRVMSTFGENEPQAAIVIWMTPAGEVQYDEVGLDPEQELLLLEATKVQIIRTGS